MHCVGKRSGLSVNQVAAMIVVGVFPLVSEKRKCSRPSPVAIMPGCGSSTCSVPWAHQRLSLELEPVRARDVKGEIDNFAVCRGQIDIGAQRIHRLMCARR